MKFGYNVPSNDTPSLWSFHYRAAGKLTQELDQTSMEIDQILSSHLSKEQKKELTNIYQKLDKAFDSDDGSAQSERKIENLFEQAHKILETSVDKLSATETKQVDALINKMDYLEHKLAGFEQHAVSGSRPVPSEQEQRYDAEANIMTTPTNKKKTLSVAELNALSATELNKLPAHLLKKLNAQQLNKLNASQLNLLPDNLLNKLTPSNLAKVVNSKYVSTLLRATIAVAHSLSSSPIQQRGDKGLTPLLY